MGALAHCEWFVQGRPRDAYAVFPIGESHDNWLAFGLTLRLFTTEEGGRSRPIGHPDSEYVKFQYMPNWALPGMKGKEQIGAGVLWLGTYPVEPGETVRAVVVPLTSKSIPRWRVVAPGDELRLFEGKKVCGLATVEWVRSTGRPVPESDQDRFVAWAQGAELAK
jgi:hypothetical protein